LILGWDDLSIGDSEVLKPYTINITDIAGNYLCFKSSSVYLMKLVAPTLGAYKLTIVISS
jgi:hypothetical protein